MSLLSIEPFFIQLLQGTWMTLQLVICSLLLGAVTAVLLTLAYETQRKWLQIPINIFTFLIRGTPLLVQIFLIYYGSSQFEALRNSIFWVVLQKPFACAILALAINTCAYTTVLFCGAIKSLPVGEIEACKALGMSWMLMMRKIILPRAIRFALPAYSNEVVMVLKGTSLASTITILDLMGVTQRIISQTYAAVEFLILAGVIYFILNALVIAGFRLLETRLNAYLRAA